MSAAAEQRVRTFVLVHPEVKGGARRLLEVIATQIPEGQTMTPEITIPELTALMGYGNNAARRSRRDLVKVGVVRIVDGGQGQVSRYELMLLPDAKSYDPALPLIGATPPPSPARVRRPRPSTRPTLFDDVTEIRASDIVQKDRSWRLDFDPFVRSARWIGAVLRSFCTMLRFNFVQKDRSSHQVLDVDVTRARDVHTFKKVHTHAAAAPEPAERSNPPPRQPVHAWHAWCDGLVHVPKLLHEEFVRTHRRRAHETDGDVEATLFAFYARTCAALPDDWQPPGNDFDFWRPAYAAAFSPPGRARSAFFAAPTPQRRADGVTGSNCGHDPRCTGRTADCIARTIADARAERREKSG